MDPDVILGGEVRDDETAKIAAQAALTGHLVFSSIHANDAVGVMHRMLDLNVEPFILCST
jgi:type II secretory ATPase GspE/PulE/Tfp pilus assembly ATPase PilB-like protein